jgi:hypothetical protein
VWFFAPTQIFRDQATQSRPTIEIAQHRLSFPIHHYSNSIYNRKNSQLSSAKLTKGCTLAGLFHKGLAKVRSTVYEPSRAPCAAGEPVFPNTLERR